MSNREDNDDRNGSSGGESDSDQVVVPPLSQDWVEVNFFILFVIVTVVTSKFSPFYFYHRLMMI
jgi:hypothetical protein